MSKKPTYEELEQRVKELEESERKYCHLFETSLVGIYRTRIDDGKFLAANQALSELMGYDSVNQFVSEYVTSKHYTDPQRREELLRQIQSKGRVDGFEIEMARTDGSRVQVAISAAIYTEHGYLEGFVIDISDRKKAEEALRESEERYRAFFEEGPDGVVVLDPETAMIIEFNDQACRQLGYSREEFARLRVPDIEAKETAEETRLHIQKIMNKGHGDFDTLQHSKQGEIRHVHVTAQLIKIAGDPVYHCIWRDISDRKLAEKEREKLIKKLLKALKEIKTLRGILPLCSYCKKIRDDKGYWEKVDVYIDKYSQADISHSICPECAKEYFPDMDIYDD